MPLGLRGQETGAVEEAAGLVSFSQLLCGPQPYTLVHSTHSPLGPGSRSVTAHLSRTLVFLFCGQILLILHKCVQISVDKDFVSCYRTPQKRERDCCFLKPPNFRSLVYVLVISDF